MTIDLNSQLHLLLPGFFALWAIAFLVLKFYKPLVVIADTDVKRVLASFIGTILAIVLTFVTGTYWHP